MFVAYSCGRPSYILIRSSVRAAHFAGNSPRAASLRKISSMSRRNFGSAISCCTIIHAASVACRSEEHTSELQSQSNLVCRLLLEKKNTAAPSSRNIAARPPPPTVASTTLQPPVAHPPTASAKPHRERPPPNVSHSQITYTLFRL